MAAKSAENEISGADEFAAVFQKIFPQLRGNERLETRILETDRGAGRDPMKKLLKKLNDAGVRYVVIGGQAMRQKGKIIRRDLFFRALL